MPRDSPERESMDQKRYFLPTVGPSVISILAMMPPIVVADDGPAAERRRAADRSTLEIRQLVPTRVPGDLAGRPVTEVLDALGRATGFSLRLTSDSRDSPGRPDEAQSIEGGPTFWETLNPLAREARLVIVPRMAIEGRGLELEPLRGMPAPSTVHGAFRCSLIRLIQDRRVLHGDPSTEVPDSTIREPARMAGTNLPPTCEQSHALILLLAEPRGLIDVQLSGPPRVDEAIDAVDLVADDPDRRRAGLEGPIDQRPGQPGLGGECGPLGHASLLAPKVVADLVGVPVGAPPEMPEAIGGGVADLLGELPGVLARHRPEGADEVRPDSITRLAASKPSTPNTSARSSSNAPAGPVRSPRSGPKSETRSRSATEGDATSD